MRSTISVVDRVGESEQLLLIGISPLQSDLNRLGTGAVVSLVFEIDRGLVERRLVSVEMVDEARDAASVVELNRFVRALVVEIDVRSTVEKSELANSLLQRLVLELEDRENLRIG